MMRNITKHLHRILSVFEWVLFITLAGLFTLLLLPVLPIHHVIQSYVVPTGSMEPTIAVGSLVLTVPPDSLQKNDIIAFTDPKDRKKTIIHRIINIDNQTKAVTYETKGDNNNAPDPWIIPAPLVKGRLLAALPYLGYISADVRSPQGFAFIIILPSILLVLLQLKNIKQGIDHEVAKRTSALIPTTLGIILFASGLSFVASSTLKPPVAYATYTTKVSFSHVNFKSEDIDAPKISVKKLDHETAIQFFIQNVTAFKHIGYTITYDTETVTQQVEGNEQLTSNQQYSSPKILLGTCSQKDCTFDKGVKDIHIQIVLSNSNNKVTLTKDL